MALLSAASRIRAALPTELRMFFPGRVTKRYKFPTDDGTFVVNSVQVYTAIREMLRT